jgi:hypothetical protein
VALGVFEYAKCEINIKRTNRECLKL